MKESEVVINIENCRVEELIGVDGEKSSASEERRMSMSAKKPPRPPRGLSLDASDQKLIKEISEILMMKRERIERMKKKKKSKAAAAAAVKGRSSSSSSNSSTTGNLIAMLFTLAFCIVIIFQGGSRSAGTNIIIRPISGKGDDQINSSSRTTTTLHTFV